MALQNIIKQAKNAVQPDAIEILPGVLQPKIVRYITKHSPVPVMCGGLVTVKEDVIHCLQEWSDCGFYDAERFVGPIVLTV